jgi:hypothetical protein
MPTFTFKGPNGETRRIEGPEGATREQAVAMFDELLQVETQQGGKGGKPAPDDRPWYAKAGEAADDIVRLGVNGATFGYADKLAGYMGGEGVDAERAKSAQASERAGLAGTVAEIGGSVIPAVGAARAGVTAASLLPKGAGMLGRTAAAGADGAALGALYASGHDEDIGKGAMIGAAAGGFGSAAIDAIPALVRFGGRVIAVPGNAASGGGNALAQAKQASGKPMPWGPPSAPVQSPTASVPAVGERLAPRPAGASAHPLDDAYGASWHMRDADELGRVVDDAGDNALAASVAKARAPAAAKPPKAEPALSPADVRAARDIKDAMVANRFGPAEADAIFEQFQYVKNAGRGTKPQSLADFVIKGGGLQNQGEIRTMLGGSGRNRPGLLNDKNGGTGLDDMAHRAWEAGYLPGESRPSINAFLEALGDDVNGVRRVVRQADEHLLDDLNVSDEMLADLERLGITSKTPERVVREALGLPPAKTSVMERAYTKARSDNELLNARDANTVPF